MEDASKEFQIFMSPTRDYQQPYREVTTSKHRIVPVINKILSSSSSTFTLNQRKCSVYKAVSGVSFQDTDVVEKKPVTRKRDRKKERRQSYAAPIIDSEKTHQMLPPAPGTRRSRSLTSMESAITISTESSKNLPEITHPFTPVIIYNQSCGRKSRYSRIKDKKRSSSQVRTAMELKKQEENTSQKIEQPIRPRRTRSASRSRRPLSLISFSSEEILDSPSQRKDSLQLRYGKQLSQNSNNIYQKTSSHHSHEIISTICSRRSNESPEIDFSVNDNDWKKYDILVTEKLDSLLKKKEEPEGGYFSLEREESEDLDRFIEGGEHFQRDNSSETIYIAQAFTKEKKVCDIPAKYDQYTVEEIYSEVPFSNQGQEVGFTDDEGLYEEIFYNKTNEQEAPTIFNNINYGETSKINILVSSNLQTTQSMPKSVGEIKTPKIEKSSSSTIVYIGGEDSNTSKSDFDHFIHSSHSLKQSISCTNLLHWENQSKPNKNKKLSVVEIGNNKLDTSEDKCQINSSVWCGCYTRPNFQSNHSSSCIRSRPGQLSSKYSQFADTKEEENINRYNAKIDNEMYVPQNLMENVITVVSNDLNTKNTSNSEAPEPDYELSDIDLDMFAPKPFNENSPFYQGNHMIRSSSEVHLNLQSFIPLGYSNFSKSMKDNFPHSTDITSPKTFRGFLEDSIFNPPDTDSTPDDNEDLVIEEDQIVTCITDTDSSSSTSSSSDSEGDDVATVTSPWLEAKNEFEFLTFKDEKKKPLRLFRRKKTKKVVQNSKFGNPFLLENKPSESRHKDFYARNSSTELYNL